MTARLPPTQAQAEGHRYGFQSVLEPKLIGLLDFGILRDRLGCPAVGQGYANDDVGNVCSKPDPDARRGQLN